MRCISSLVIALLALFPVQALAKPVTEPVTYAQGSTELKGVLIRDDSVQGRRPGVIVIHEWWGLNDFAKGVAARLAEMGYVALAADVYGGGVTTTDAKRAAELSGQVRGDRGLLLERAKAALEVLGKSPHVLTGQVAAIGFCFGGTVVLEMARGGLPLKGVASFHGQLATNKPAQAGQGSGMSCPVLVLHGASDPLVPDKELMGFVDEMRQAQADWQLIMLGGARHSFTNPAADQDPLEPTAYDRKAAERSFDYLRVFLSELFGT